MFTQTYTDFKRAHFHADKQDKPLGYSIQHGFYVAYDRATFEVSPSLVGDAFDAYHLVASLCALKVCEEMYQNAGLVGHAVPHEVMEGMMHDLFPDTKGV